MPGQTYEKEYETVVTQVEMIQFFRFKELKNVLDEMKTSD